VIVFAFCCFVPSSTRGVAFVCDETTLAGDVVDVVGVVVVVVVVVVEAVAGIDVDDGEVVAVVDDDDGNMVALDRCPFEESIRFTPRGDSPIESNNLGSMETWTKENQCQEETKVDTHTHTHTQYLIRYPLHLPLHFD
jgi:hypothetical protein